MLLSEIAKAMMIETTIGKYKATRNLRRGLEITLFNRDKYCYWRLYRTALRSPSKSDCDICRNAFFSGEAHIEHEGYRTDRRGGISYWIRMKHQP